MFQNYHNSIREELIDLGFNITYSDLNRPWGAFFYIDESQSQFFSDNFFKELFFIEFVSAAKPTTNLGLSEL